jgi:hypothetical protein
MIFTYIKAYKDEVFLGYEHLYLGNNHTKALERCIQENPEFKECILMAETYDSEDVKNQEHYQACVRCNCIS